MTSATDHGLTVHVLRHRGRDYYSTGKVGTRFTDAATVYEFRCRQDGYDYRIWAKGDGTEITED